MKQKTRFKNFGNIGIGYWSMNGRYVGIGPNKAISVDLYLRTYYLKSFFFTWPILQARKHELGGAYCFSGVGGLYVA